MRGWPTTSAPDGKTTASDVAKVFGIGLSRTGTRSLDAAFKELGLRSEHLLFDLDRIAHLDAATHAPVARAYEELDRRYPGSRFILTVRSRDDWLESCRRFFRREPASGSTEDLLLDLYGTTTFDADSFAAAYRAHRRDVLRHFRRRPGDLLVLDVCGGEGWEKLCAFLGLPVPDVPFPHRHQAPADDLLELHPSASRALQDLLRTP